MSIKMNGGLIHIVYVAEGLEALVEQIRTVAQPQCRRMGDKQINALAAANLRLQTLDSAPHLLIGILIKTGMGAFAAAKTHHSDALIFNDSAVDIDAALRRLSFVFLVMIPGYIKQRTRNHGDQKRQIPGGQIAAGNNHFNVTKPLRVKMIPDKLAFDIRDNQNLHGLPPET